jgi:hypothetical protein
MGEWVYSFAILELDTRYYMGSLTLTNLLSAAHQITKACQMWGMPERNLNGLEHTWTCSFYPSRLMWGWIICSGWSQNKSTKLPRYWRRMLLYSEINAEKAVATFRLKIKNNNFKIFIILIPYVHINCHHHYHHRHQYSLAYFFDLFFWNCFIQIYNHKS